MYNWGSSWCVSVLYWRCRTKVVEWWSLNWFQVDIKLLNYLLLIKWSNQAIIFPTLINFNHRCRDNLLLETYRHRYSSEFMSTCTSPFNNFCSTPLIKRWCISGWSLYRAVYIGESKLQWNQFKMAFFVSLFTARVEKQV